MLETPLAKNFGELWGRPDFSQEKENQEWESGNALQNAENA